MAKFSTPEEAVAARKVRLHLFMAGLHSSVLFLSLVSALVMVLPQILLHGQFSAPEAAAAARKVRLHGVWKGVTDRYWYH
jgi:hypothetical protein